MKLWWIGCEQESGYVSDSFEGIFSTKEKAQAFVDVQNKKLWPDALTIYETTLDEKETG